MSAGTPNLFSDAHERIERLREAIWILAMETEMRPESLARLRELLEVARKEE